MEVTLLDLINQFETNHPHHNWLVRKVRKNWYLASAAPIGYVARISGPNPDIFKAEAKTATNALTQVLKLMNKETHG